MELDEPVPALETLQTHFIRVLKARLATSSDETLKVHKDASYTENPMEREDIEESVKVDNLASFDELLKTLKEGDYPHLDCIRVPVVEERAPQEECFDIMVNTLKNEPASTQCVFSCQMGRGRTTLGNEEKVSTLFKYTN